MGNVLLGVYGDGACLNPHRRWQLLDGWPETDLKLYMCGRRRLRLGVWDPAA